MKIIEVITDNESVLFEKIKEIWDHMLSHEKTYKYYIKHEKYFIVCLLQKIHYRVQKFFCSCLGAKQASDIQFKFIDFSSLTSEIEFQKFVINPPICCKNLKPKAEAKLATQANKGSGKNKHDGGTTNGNGNGGNNGSGNDNGGGGNKRRTIWNDHIDPVCKLAPTERLNKVFHPKNTVGLVHPQKNGEDICLSFHCVGCCHSKQKHLNTHGPLGNSAPDLRSFVKKAKKEYKKFTERNRNTDNDQNQNPPPASAAAADNVQGQGENSDSD